eukprot:g15371.t1
MPREMRPPERRRQAKRQSSLNSQRRVPCPSVTTTAFSTAPKYGAGASPSEIEERAKRHICAQVVEYLPRCSGRGRMKVGEGSLTLPCVSFTASGAAAAAEGHGERDDVRNVVSTPPAALAVPKRTHEDMQDFLNELDGVAERAVGGGIGSNLGLSAGSAAKKTKPTLEHGQPLVAALWPQGKHKSKSDEGDIVDRSAIIKEPTTGGKLLSSDKLSGLKSSSWGGFPVQPTMLSAHLCDQGSTAARGAIAAFGRTSAFGDFSGSTA